MDLVTVYPLSVHQQDIRILGQKELASFWKESASFWAHSGGLFFSITLRKPSSAPSFSSSCPLDLDKSKLTIPAWSHLSLSSSRLMKCWCWTCRTACLYFNNCFLMYPGIKISNICFVWFQLRVMSYYKVPVQSSASLYFSLRQLIKCSTCSLPRYLIPKSSTTREKVIVWVSCFQSPGVLTH